MNCIKSIAKRVRFLVLATAVFAGLSVPVTASEKEQHVFKLYIRGIAAGYISITAAKNTTNYALSGSVQPTAFLRALRDVGYQGTAKGTYKATAYRPSAYSGNTKTGSRNSVVKMRFRGGRPIVDSYLPARAKRPYDLNPSAQTGTLDLLTSAYSVFADSPAGKLCNRVIPMFDGRRRTKLTLSQPKVSSDGATCRGTYSRVAGFSPQDMKEQVNFPFTLVYDRLDDGSYRLMSFRTESTFGSAKAVRR